MTRNIIGKSKIEICSLGMGCWAYGGGNYWGEQAQDDVDNVVRYALDNGINYFDTAEVYNNGSSEESLGIALKGIRSKAVVGTKISTSNVKRDILIKHCEDSLKRLQTDYIDIYMLHWPVNAKSVEHFSVDATFGDIPSVAEVFETMNLLKKQGKIREIGVSNHGVLQTKELIATGVDIAVNELPYNLISRAIEAEVLPLCQQENIGILGYMAFQQGILTGQFNDFSKLRPSQVHSRHFKNERGGDESRHFEDGAEEELLCLLNNLEILSKDTGIPVAKLTLCYAMSKKGISSTLVGSRNIEELKMNIESANFVLSNDLITELDTLSKPVWDALGDSIDYYENRKTSRVW